MSDEAKTTDTKSATKIELPLPSTRIGTDARHAIAVRIATLALKPEVDAIRKAIADLAVQMVAHVKTHPEYVVASTIPAWVNERKSGNIIEVMDKGRTVCKFTLPETIFMPLHESWQSEWPSSHKDMWRADHVEQMAALNRAEKDAQERYTSLVRELEGNLATARTVKRACELWPEAKSIILDVMRIEHGVEVPLEAILGRYTKALPAPTPSTGTATPNPDAAPAEAGQPEPTDVTPSNEGVAPEVQG